MMLDRSIDMGKGGLIFVRQRLARTHRAPTKQLSLCSFAWLDGRIRTYFGLILYIVGTTCQPCTIATRPFYAASCPLWRVPSPLGPAVQGVYLFPVRTLRRCRRFPNSSCPTTATTIGLRNWTASHSNLTMVEAVAGIPQTTMDHLAALVRRPMAIEEAAAAVDTEAEEVDTEAEEVAEAATTTARTSATPPATRPTLMLPPSRHCSTIEFSTSASATTRLPTRSETNFSRNIRSAWMIANGRGGPDAALEGVV